MQSNTSKIVLAVIITAIIVGGGVYYWQTSQRNEPDIVTQQPKVRANLEIYASEKYSFQYPQGYFVQEPSTEPGQLFPVLTVRKAANKKEADEKRNVASKNRLEIFQMKDFGDRPWGFEGTETQEDIDGYVPKEQLTVGTGDKKYDVWLYYSENDSMTKKELKTIFDSIVIK